VVVSCTHCADETGERQEHAERNDRGKDAGRGFMAGCRRCGCKNGARVGEQDKGRRRKERDNASDVAR